MERRISTFFQSQAKDYACKHKKARPVFTGAGQRRDQGDANLMHYLKVRSDWAWSPRVSASCLPTRGCVDQSLPYDNIENNPRVSVRDLATQVCTRITDWTDWHPDSHAAHVEVLNLPAAYRSVGWLRFLSPKGYQIYAAGSDATASTEVLWILVHRPCFADVRQWFNWKVDAHRSGVRELDADRFSHTSSAVQ